jgi:hypothetical protein
MRRKWRRSASIGERLRWLGATLVVLEIAYLIFGNLFLRFGLRRIANGSPQEVMLEYESAYTLWPGTASIRGYRLRSQDTHIQWRLDVEHADITVDLLALFRRTFHATRIRAEGVSFRLRRKLSDAAAPSAGALPPIEGYDDPPMKAIGPPGPPTTDAEYADVMVNLEDTEASVREIWVDEFRILGPAHVKGRWFFKPERLMQLGPVALDIDSGELEVGGERVLTSLDAHLTSTVGVIDFRGPMTGNVRAISGRGAIDAQVTSLELVRLYLGDPPAFHVDGSGALHFSLLVEHGRAMPGTRVLVESDHLVIGTKGVEATVAFACEARVDAGRDAPIATGDLRVREATVVLGSRAGEPPVIEAARVHFRGLPRDLAGTAEIEHTSLDVPVRFPDLGWLLPRPERGALREVSLAGSGALRAKIDLDRRFHGAGVVGAEAHLAVHAGGVSTAARLSATVGFEGLDLATKSLVLRPSAVTADHVAITREGHSHGGGTARVDVTAGRVGEGRPRDLAITIAAQHPDLSWLALRSSGKGALGAVARAGEARAVVRIPRPDALFGGSPADAAVSGSIEVSGSGDARFEGVTMRGKVAATAVIEALDLGRRTARLRRLHLTMRDVSVDRESDHTRGWWGDVDLPKLDGSLAGAAELAAHVDVRTRDGAPFLAVLVGAGQIPGWVAGLFPMKHLTASVDMRLAHAIADLDLLVRSTSVGVTARMHDLGGAMDGAILVKTAVVSIGVGFKRGESHTKVFAGEDWLKEHVEAATREETVAAKREDPRSP